MLSCNTRFDEFESTIRASKEETIQRTDRKILSCDKRIDEINTTFRLFKEKITKNVDSCMSTVNKKQNTDMINIRQSQQYAMDAIAATKGSKNGNFIWKIEKFSKKKKKVNTLTKGLIDAYSDDFYTSEYGYKMKLGMTFHKEHVNVFVEFVPGENDAHLPSVFDHRKTYYVLDQSDRRDKRHIVKVDEPYFKGAQSECWTKTHKASSTTFTYTLLETKYNNAYVKDDNLFLKVVVEPIFPLSRCPFSRDGFLYWKVSNYSRTKQESQDEINKWLNSDYFYSSASGYRMQCYLYFSNDTLLINLSFLEGEFDGSLPDVYSHKVTFTVVDQMDKSGTNNLHAVDTLDPNVIGYEKARERMLHAPGCSSADFLFVRFEKNPFYDNDSILLQIDVKPI